MRATASDYLKRERVDEWKKKIKKVSLSLFERFGLDMYFTGGLISTCMDTMQAGRERERERERGMAANQIREQQRVIIVNGKYL